MLEAAWRVERKNAVLKKGWHYKKLEPLPVSYDAWDGDEWFFYAHVACDMEIVA
jgi:hypothetical protein